MKKDYSNIVNDYLENKFSPQECSEYDKELSKNTELKREHLLQKQSIQGIKTSRYKSLKNRLNNLPIPTIIPNSTSKIATTTGKLIATVGGGAVLVASLYFGYSYMNESSSPEIIHSQTAEKIAYSNKHTPIINQEKNIQSDDLVLTAPKEIESNKIQSTEETIQRKNSITSIKKKTTVLKDSLGQVIMNDNEGNSPIDYHKLEHPTLPFTDIDNDIKIEEDSVVVSNNNFNDNISTINDASSKYKFHYQFENGNLVLYGRFGTTYKVIEINDDGKNEFYLFYKKNYYKLESSKNTPTPLEKISDENLKIIKKKLVN